MQTGMTINVQTSTDLQTWTTLSTNDSPADFFSQQIGTDSVTGDPIIQVGVKENGTGRQFTPAGCDDAHSDGTTCQCLCLR